LIRVIEAVSIAARWGVRGALAVDHVINRIAKGDRGLAFGAIDALVRAGLLVEVTTAGEQVYRLADKYKETK
jgi:hypothetical protein